MKIKYICPKHGEHQSVLSNMALKGTGCIDCRNELYSNIYSLSPTYVENYINNFNNNVLLNKNDYISYDMPNLKIKCGTCGNIYVTSYNLYKISEHKKCPTCKPFSNGESRIEKYLIDNNIKYIPQKKFDDCVDIRPLPFDFYLINYNLCIEYDGEGHYLINFYERFDDPSKEFKKTQLHDKIKTDYCAAHGINLLRIPYWEKDNIEKIILNKIQELKIQIA